MNAPLQTLVTAPGALRYMAQAFRPSSGWNTHAGAPDMELVWQGFHIDQETVLSLQRSAGSGQPLAADCIALLAPHVLGFRLLMAMLTHPRWPLPIWRALQVRNRLQLHRPLEIGEPFMLSVAAAGWRVLEKGLEIDLHSRLLQGDQCAWESVITFYYRGRFGAAASSGVALGAAPDSPPIDDAASKPVQWRTELGNRWHFGALTGDYNGLHQWNWYARRFGFPAAFAHPQRIAAQCLARLPAPDAGPLQLDLWIKGPVFYGREVALRQSLRPAPAGRDFALTMMGENRPALLGSLRVPHAPQVVSPPTAPVSLAPAA